MGSFCAMVTLLLICFTAPMDAAAAVRSHEANPPTDPSPGPTDPSPKPSGPIPPPQPPVPKPNPTYPSPLPGFDPAALGCESSHL